MLVSFDLLTEVLRGRLQHAEGKLARLPTKPRRHGRWQRVHRRWCSVALTLGGHTPVGWSGRKGKQWYARHRQNQDVRRAKDDGLNSVCQQPYGHKGSMARSHHRLHSGR